MNTLNSENLDAFVDSYGEALHRGVLSQVARHYHRSFSAAFVAGDAAAVGDFDAFFEEFRRHEPYAEGDMRFELCEIKRQGPWAEMRGVMCIRSYGEIDCRYLLTQTAEGWGIMSKVIIHRY